MIISFLTPVGRSDHFCCTFITSDVTSRLLSREHQSSSIALDRKVEVSQPGSRNTMSFTSQNLARQRQKASFEPTFEVASFTVGLMNWAIRGCLLWQICCLFLDSAALFLNSIVTGARMHTALPFAAGTRQRLPDGYTGLVLTPQDPHATERGCAWVGSSRFKEVTCWTHGPPGGGDQGITHALEWIRLAAHMHGSN